MVTFESDRYRRVAVDSDALLDQEGAGAFDSVERLIVRRALVVPAIVVFEALRVADQDRARLEVLFRGVRVDPVDDRVARRAAAVWAELKRSGAGIGERDVLIASSCLVYKLPLLTRNVRHFKRVDGLTVLGS
jgi:predicted nucleic acid-binding protein